MGRRKRPPQDLREYPSPPAEGASPSVRILRLGEAFALLLAGAFVALRPLIAAEPFGSAHNMALSCLPLVAWLVTVFLRGAVGGTVPVPRRAPALPLAAFLLLVLASPLVASSRWPTAVVAVVWSGHFALFQLVGMSDRRGNLWRTLLAALAASVAIEALYAFVQWGLLYDETRRAIAQDPSRMHFIPTANLEEFLSRPASGEPYGSFVTCNSLAGFLALVLPLLLWLAICGLRTARVGFTALALACTVLLGLTRSKGGFVALAVACVTLAALEKREWLARRRKGLLAAAALLALAGGWGAAVWEPAPHSSLGFRYGYWRAGIRMVADHPIAGVGLENFADHYTRYKSETAGEVQRAHNDWLQIAAELGVPGVLAFAAFWAALLLPVIRGAPPGPTSPDPDALPAGPAAVLVGLVGAATVAGTEIAGVPLPLLSLLGPVQRLAVGGLWLWFFLQAHGTLVRAVPTDPAAPSASVPGASSLRPVLAAGLAATLVHSLADMNFYVHNFSGCVLLLSGALFAAEGGTTAGPVSAVKRRLALAGAAAMGLAVAAGWYVLQTRLLPAETLRDLARYGEEEGVRPTLRRQQHLLAEAAALNPWDPAGLQQLGAALHMECRAIQGGPGGSRELETRILRPCEQVAEQARARAPESAGLAAQLALVRWDHARLLRRHAAAHPPDAAADETSARALIEGALAEARVAVLHYPTHARYRLHLARLLDETGRGEEAVPHYRRAWELHRVQTLGRLELDPEEVRLVKQRLRR